MKLKMNIDKKKYKVNDFKLLTVFGYGNYAKVALVRRNDDLRIYAMKVIKKQNRIRRVKKSHAYIQKQILMRVNHPFIIKMHATFQDQNRLYFILDYCPGGELFGLLRRNRRLSEDSCRFYASQILLALQYLHSQKIIYRDLKPENIVLDPNGYIRLIDFGLSISNNAGAELPQKDLAGTAYFLPPEALTLNQKLDYSIDWWSFGSLIFELIMGFPPFYSNSQKMKDLLQKIKHKDPPLEYINSETLRDFLKGLLQKDPQKRLGFRSVEQIKKHPWMLGVEWQKIAHKQIKAPYIPELSNEQDTKLFQEEELPVCPGELTPPQQMEGDGEEGQKYKSFSLSWQSSSERSPKQASPIEIDLVEPGKQEQCVQMEMVKQQAPSWEKNYK